MNSSGLEVLFGGIIVALISAMIGKFIGEKDKLDKGDFEELCEERRSTCTAHICSELAHIEKGQGELRSDIKTLLKHTVGGN